MDIKIGLNDKETKAYSIVRAIRALMEGGPKAAPLEYEASAAVAAHLTKTGRPTSGFFIPGDVLERDLTLGSGGSGGYLKGTDHNGESFIELLRNRLIVRRLGATILDELVGDVTIPRQSGGATGYWVAENSAPTESEQSFEQVTLAPRSVAAYTDFTRKLLLQSSPAVENIVRTDLARVIALAIDLAAINGSGASNQPTGILNVTGIGDVALGTNGAAPTYANMVDIWNEVAQDNADVGDLGWLTNSTMIAKLSQTEKASSTGQFVIQDLPGVDGMTSLLGMKCGMSNQIPSTLTKGSSNDCSAIIFGNWADLLIGEWGALEILLDPYTGGTSGRVRVRVFQDVDIAVRHPESFAATKDARNI